MASFGRGNLGSFGRRQLPAEQHDDVVPEERPSSTTLVVDLVVSPESLEKVTADVAAAVRAGVELGFATAGTPEIDPETNPE